MPKLKELAAKRRRPDEDDGDNEEFVDEEDSADDEATMEAEVPWWSHALMSVDVQVRWRASFR